MSLVLYEEAQLDENFFPVVTKEEQVQGSYAIFPLKKLKKLLVAQKR